MPPSAPAHPDGARSGSVPAFVRARATSWPDAVALVDAAGQVSFAGLLTRVDEIAQRLRAAGVPPGAVVGVSARRSAAAVIAMVAVQEAGATCVPLDPAYPPERLRFMIEDSRVAVVLSDEPEHERWRGATALALDASGSPPRAPAWHVPGDGIGWVFYTSGSSGRPKGVLLRHATIVARLVAEPIAWQADDRGCLKSSLSYGDSVSEIFAPLAHGQAVVIADDDTARDPRLLSRLIERERVTRLLAVPALLSALLDLPPADRARLGRLRSCIATGELLTGGLAERFYATLPDASLLNVYGTTECWEVCWHAVPRDVRAGDGVPIGSRLFDGARTWVVDDALVPLPPGTAGELLVGGPGLSGGYLARPELTAERFVPPPPGVQDPGPVYRTGDVVVCREDGVLELVGRRDQQVNLRGFRIEIEEVERWVRDCRGVAEGAVAATTDDDGTVVGLTGFVVPASGGEPTAAELRTELAEHLPDHCLPSGWIRLARLPLLSNGKVDRSALATLAACQPATIAAGANADDGRPPLGEVERTLVRIWHELLGVETIGVSDDFFALGGSSLLAVQVVIRVEQELGVEVPLRDFYARPTIATLSAVVQGVSAAALIEQLRRLPDDARTYGCDDHFARLHFGFDADALRDLVDAGLPAVVRDGGLRFEYGDLHFLGLRLGTASTYLWAVEGWARALTRFAERPRTEVTIAYVPQLGAVDGTPTGVVRLPDGLERRVALENGRCVAEARIVLESAWPELPPPAARVVREVADSIAFCMLPPALQGDVELVRRIGLSDCVTAAQLIVAEWRTAGLDARISGGLLVSLPYSTPHGWPEVRCDGVWVPVDPLMLQVMCAFGGLDAAEWPPERSVGAMLRRLDRPDAPLLLADDEEVELSLMTTVSAAAAA